MTTATPENTTTQLNALVERGAPTSEFLPFFPTRRQAANYLASANAARFHPNAAADRCAVCNQQPVTRSITYLWNAVFFDGFGFGPLDALKLMLGHVGVTIKKEIIAFNTTHPLCETCGKRLRNRRWIANILNFIGLFTLIVAGVAASISWAGLFYFDFKKTAERNEWYTMTAISTAVLLAGAICLWLMKRLRVPPTLRFLARRPFFYQSSKMLTRAQ
jgi:hypothetical protein